MKSTLLPILASLVLFYTTGCSKKSDPAPPLAIAGFIPSHGPKDTTVIITGTGFSTSLTNDHVYFNGKEAIITSGTATQLVVKVPLQAGTGPLTVSVNGSTQTGTIFTYDFSDVLVSTFAGSNTTGTADGAGTAAAFNSPIDIAIDASGNLYVPDAGIGRIRQITPAGIVSTFAGNQIGFQEGTGPNARFNYPEAVAVDAAGNCYVADAGNNCIRKVTPNGTVTTFAGSATAGDADGSGGAAQFRSPWGLTMDVSGNLYVADNFSRIRKITPTGLVSTFAGTSSTGYSEGPVATALFNDLKGMVFDRSGNLFVCDEVNHVIRKITSAGIVSTWAATDNTVVPRLDEPTSATIDSNGDLIVVDAGNSLIRLITPAGTVSVLAGSAAGYADGNKATALFSHPAGIVIDKHGALYVADNGNHCIRKLILQ